MFYSSSVGPVGKRAEVDRYSNYATASMEAVIQISSEPAEQTKAKLRAYVPEASQSYYVDIQYDPDEDDW